MEVFFLVIGNYFDSLYLYLRVAFFSICTLTTFILIIRWIFNEPKEEDSTPKQDIKITDYQMVLDSMLIYGIINGEQYNEYLSNGLPYYDEK